MKLCCERNSLTFKKNGTLSGIWLIVLLAALSALFFGAWRFFYYAQSSESMPVVAIAQIAEHPSLDQVREAFIASLRQAGYEHNKTVRFVLDNAQGSTQYATEIAKKFAAVNPDLSLAIGTPVAQSLKNTLPQMHIPLLFAAITDPVAAKLVKTRDPGDPWVAGVTDEQPVAEQLELIQTLLPQAKTLGIVYHSGEINSSIMVEQVKAQGRFTILEQAVSKNHEVAAAIHALAGRVDALYIPLDNLIVSSLNAYLKASAEHNLPVFSADPDLVKKGVLASRGVSYEAVGQLAARMAVQLLKKEARVEDLGIQKPSQSHLVINEERAQQLGLSVPQGLLD